ncbi:MAG: transglutaminase domain-containing protein [Candidatus Aminicenantes bacterium]|nr:transglutaminase domain-containing protein [Candidatus Aminicenantes bacterium]
MRTNSNSSARKLPPVLIIVSFLLLVIFIGIYWLLLANKVNRDRETGDTAKAVAQVQKSIHVPLFINPEKIRHQSRFNFTFDPPEVLKKYRESENLDQVTAGTRSDFKKTLRLMKWTRDQWEPGLPDPYPPINALRILAEIRSGWTGGFCAQYNYVFVQGLQSLSIPARYITVLGHEVTEVWIKEFEKWLCFDPLHNAYYTDEKEVLLSVFDIYRRVKNNRPVRLVGDKLPADIQSHLKKFLRFSVWIKNNHVSSPVNFSDLEYYKVHFFENNENYWLSNPPGLWTSSLNDLYFPIRAYPANTLE